MPYDRFFIAPYDTNSGLQNDVRPFLIPDQAFARCKNAYQWRGRVRKRFGSRWLGGTQQLTRLKINVGTTNGSGNLSSTVPGAIFKQGQSFSIGNAWYTVYLAGAVQTMLKTVTTTTATYSTTNGAFNFVGAPINSIVYFYPAEPVMGLDTYEESTQSDEGTIAFDTQFAYQYMNTGWERISTEAQSGASVWTGSNSQLFWSASYGATSPSDYALFVTNFNQNEPNGMRYLVDGEWNNFMPLLDASTTLQAAAILVPFHNHLIAFNIWEATDEPTLTHYPFRATWSAIGDPTGSTAWRRDIAEIGGANALDCPSNEAIITVEFIKNRLIVYLERSTWEFVYVGNQIQPFVWQQINTELGAESRFSIVPFDRVALGIADIGIHACNGTNVERIDNDIPNEIFNIHTTSNGFDRVFGIRDYSLEMVYWTFPNASRWADQPFPNQILVYNYKTNTWSFNDDSITCFGYFQPTTPPDWTSTTTYWNTLTPWSNENYQSLFRQVIAGNQEGFTFIIDPGVPVNAPNLQITNITITGNPNVLNFYVRNHNLQAGDYIYFTNIQASGNMELLNETIFQVQNYVDANNFLVLYFDSNNSVISGVYQGLGNISLVSLIDILTKQYSLYFKQGRNCYVPKVDFLVDTTLGGQLVVDYFVSTSDVSMVNISSSVGTNSIVGTNILETFPYPDVAFEQDAKQVWHPVYFQADGEFIQLRLYLNDSQMRNTNVMFSNFGLNAMTIYATPTSWRNQ